MWKGAIFVVVSFIALSRQIDINLFENRCKLENDFHLETNFSSVTIDKAYVCSDIELTEEDQRDIQWHKYDISMEKNIVLKGGALGCVNRNFFNLFPQSKEIYFLNTTMKVNCTEDAINSHVHPLKSIYIESSDIKGNKNPNLFNYLRSLKRIRMVNNKMEYKTLDKYFFKTVDKKEMHIKEVEVVDCDFEKIQSDAFDYLTKLETLLVVSMNIELPKDYLKRNHELENVKINGKRF